MKYKHIEFALATLLFITCMGAAYNEAAYGVDFWQSGQPARVDFYFDNIAAFLKEAYPQMLLIIGAYAGFLALNFYVVPQFWLTKKYFAAALLTALVLIGVSLIYTVSFSYSRSWEYDQNGIPAANVAFFSRGMVMAFFFLFVYSLYVLARQIIIYQYKASLEPQSITSRIIREVILVVSIWLIGLIPCIILRDTGLMLHFAAFYFFVIPYSLILYFLNVYWFIPGYTQQSYADNWRYFSRAAAAALVLGAIEIAFLKQTRHRLLVIVPMFWLLPTLVTLALSWWIYLRNRETYRQLRALKTELGTSNANLQYLRSQINPHFLFNALNTLYGTALVEKAEKTGEGIQKLGDMMRFMLHENNQDRIALSRELEYIHNYIDLQTMRLALSPDVTVDIQIEDIIDYAEIAPMLLIPFIENAYKHGISLRERSWINVNLYKTDNQLHLDVHNSIHAANPNDPERLQSGTGLDNVRQRLQLLYPSRHELVVRQNAREYFVHLTLTLGGLKG